MAPSSQVEKSAKSETHTATPRFYRVVMMNDDFTTVDFVVEVLCVVFGMPASDSQNIAMTIHNDGRGIIIEGCTRDWADTKAQHSNAYARKRGHPLLCEIEPM